MIIELAKQGVAIKPKKCDKNVIYLLIPETIC